MARPSRHIMCKIQGQLNNKPKGIPVSMNPIPSTARIIDQVRNVSANVSELQKNMAVETAARRELEMSVEALRAETVEAKQHFAEAWKDDVRSNRCDNVTHILMKTLPCKSLDEMDLLLDFVGQKSLQWTEYIKFLGGSDFNSSIKKVMDAIMDRPVQKQLSWSGQQTKKPSLKIKYKKIVDGIHVAMYELFKDYTVARGEAKMHSVLRNAAKCKSG